MLKPTTIQQLLNNTSGLPSFDKTLAYNSTFIHKPRKIWQVENYLDVITGTGVKFQAGYVPKVRGYFSDSATNYFVAGLVIEAVSGIKFDDAMRALFLEFNLTNTHYLSYGQLNKSLIEQMIHGYLPISHPYSVAFSKLPCLNYNNNKELAVIDVTNAYNVNGEGNAATVSTTYDLIKWFNQLINASVVVHNYKRVFQATPTFNNIKGCKEYYCCGFYKSIFKKHGEILWTANNSLGYGALLAHVVGRDLTFALLVNVSRQHINLHSEGLVADVLNQLLQ